MAVGMVGPFANPFAMARFLWAMAGFLTLGFVGQALDRSANNVRCQNFLSGTFTFVVSIVIANWFAEATNGKWQGLGHVVTEGAHNPYLNDQANLINVLLLAYMIQDVLASIANFNFMPAYLVHHAACITGLVMTIFMGQNPVYCMALAVGEFSSPIVGLLEIAMKEDLSGLKVFSGALLNLLFPFRVAWFGWVHYVWTYNHPGSYLVATGVNMDSIGYTCSGVLFALNVYWFLKIVYKSLAAACGSSDEDEDEEHEHED